MVERVRTALVSSYAGAIIVGWTLAQGVTNVIALFMMPVTNAFIRFGNHHQTAFSSFSETKILDPIELGVGAIRAAVVLGIGLVLLKWMYLPDASLADADALKDTE